MGGWLQGSSRSNRRSRTTSPSVASWARPARYTGTASRSWTCGAACATRTAVASRHPGPGLQPPSTSACGWSTWPIRTGSPRSSPASGPSGRPGYHLTSGWIAAELIRRTDPTQRTLGRFFAEEVAAPLGLDFHIGLPPDVPDVQVARIKAFHGMRLLLHPRTMPPGMLLAFAAPGRSPPAPSSTRGWPAPGRSTARAPHPDPGRQRDRHRTRRRPAASESWPPAPGPGTHRPHPERANHPGVPPADGWGDLVFTPTSDTPPASSLPRLPLRVQRPRVRRRRRRRLVRLRRPRPGPRLRLRAQPDGLPPVRRSPRAVPPHRRLPLPWCPAAHACPNR